MDSAIAAALGALVIALANEARARSRARTAALERNEFRDDLRQIARDAASGSEMDGGAHPQG